MLTKTKIILAASLMLGTASAALAGDQTDERGGYVLPGSTDGVNPGLSPGLVPRLCGAAMPTAGYARPDRPTATRRRRSRPHRVRRHVRTQDR